MRRDPQGPNRRRRDVVRVLGTVAAANMLGCGSDSPTTPSATGTPSPSSTATPSGGTGTCVVRPQQTEGPYFVDERLNRSDIRSDPGSGAVRPGIPLRLGFRLSRLSGGACSALASAMVDVWQCDALGVYSDASDMGFNTRGQQFLRGFQLTDASGLAQFTTIYPGWYSGRAVHIHFKLRLFAGATRTYEFTSQFFFDESLTTSVHAASPYSTRGTRNTLNSTDGIYNGLSTAQKSALTLSTSKTATGYAGIINLTVNIG